MSTTTPVTVIGKMMARSGLAVELPGQPLVNSPNATTPPGLDPGEFGFAKDTGELFIGSDPSYPLFNEERLQEFPYANIRVLTESSSSVQFIQTTASQLTSVYSSIVLPANTSGATGTTDLAWNASQANIADITYVLVFNNLPNIVRKGKLSVVLTAVSSNVKDERTDVGFEYFNYTYPVAFDNYSAFEFSITTDNAASTLQYQNNTNVDAKLYYIVTTNNLQF